jgi:hypothetical protein
MSFIFSLSSLPLNFLAADCLWDWKSMAQKQKAKGRALADAVLRLSQHVHRHYPQAVLTMLDIPYTDEDLTIDVALPEGVEPREASDDLIRACLAIEDELGISILTQVSSLTVAEGTT